MPNLTPAAIQHLRDVIYHKLSSWDAAHKAEQELGVEIDTSSEELEYACSGFGDPSDIYQTTDEDVVAFFPELIDEGEAE